MSELKNILKNKKICKSVWFMRQAGRYLPEFRKIRSENPNFIKLCLNSKLSSEITLQPIKRFNLDSAIIFSYSSRKTYYWNIFTFAERNKFIIWFDAVIIKIFLFN